MKYQSKIDRKKIQFIISDFVNFNLDQNLHSILRMVQLRNNFVVLNSNFSI